MMGRYVSFSRAGAQIIRVAARAGVYECDFDGNKKGDVAVAKR
jgi:hypothetical protein